MKHILGNLTLILTVGKKYNHNYSKLATKSNENKIKINKLPLTANRQLQRKFVNLLLNVCRIPSIKKQKLDRQQFD